MSEQLIKKEGDILIFNRTRLPGIQSSALRNIKSKWLGAEIPIFFTSSISSLEKKEIIRAMLEIHTKTCVRFRDGTNDDNDYVIIARPRDPDECSSMVGRQGGGQPLFLARNCFTRNIILHELMHALGFVHEHNRSDRDDYIEIRWSNVQKEAEHNFDKRKKHDLTLIDTPYSFDSIMHYHTYAFSISERLPTIIPKNVRIKKFGESNNLSPIDVERINKYYECHEMLAEKEGLDANVQSKEETEILTTLSTTTVKPTVSPLVVPTFRWSRNDCPNPYNEPIAGGYCRWLIMKIAKDSDSDTSYLHCVPSLATSDSRCGVWTRRKCMKGMIFDNLYKSCRIMKKSDTDSDGILK